MDLRPLGRTGMRVSAVALGGGPLGHPELDDAGVERLLDVAAERGVTLVDTAPSYGESEARLGRWLRRHPEVQVSTKVGYGVPGCADWTAAAVRGGVEGARRRLGRDVLDVVHLHSCPARVLEGPAVEALLEARESGQIRAAAYSGDGDDLEAALAREAFDVVQVSSSVVDRAAEQRALPRARQGGLGVLGKRGLASGALAEPAPSDGPDRRELRGRLAALAAWDLFAVDPAGPAGFLLRFATHHAGVDATLVGTARAENLARALDAYARGPLPPAAVAELDRRYRLVGAGWPGLV